MEVLAGVIAWVLPPVLGAIIGYVTNAIAIRMLFRPLTEKRVFGIRVPLTPGLIPRERGDLAESMARMVSTELLTVDAVRMQIHAPSFKVSVTDNLTAITTELLETPLGTVGASFASGTPQGEVADSSSLLGSFSSVISSAFAGFTRSESFSELLKSLVRHFVDDLSQKPVSRVLESNHTADALLSGVLSGLTTEEGRKGIREHVSSWVDRQFRDNVNLSQFFTEADVESIAGFVDSVYPAIMKFFMRWLRSPGTRRELVVRGRYLVQDIVDRLNGFQRFIITAAQYQRTLDENMNGIIDDAVTSIEDAAMDPDSRGRIVTAVRRELLSMRERGLADIAKQQEEAIGRTAAALADRVVTVLNGPEFRGEIVQALSGSERESQQTIGELLDRVFGLEGRKPGAFVANLIFPEPASNNGDGASNQPGQIGAMVTDFLKKFVDHHRETRIRDLLGMDDTNKARFDSALATTLIATVDARVPEILESIDIHDLVVSKINGLNIEEVESLLLRVIQKHLRWINIFGAILGALIGLIQDLLRLFQLSG